MSLGSLPITGSVLGFPGLQALRLGTAGPKTLAQMWWGGGGAAPTLTKGSGVWGAAAPNCDAQRSSAPHSSHADNGKATDSTKDVRS